MRRSCHIYALRAGPLSAGASTHSPLTVAGFVGASWVSREQSMIAIVAPCGIGVNSQVTFRKVPVASSQPERVGTAAVRILETRVSCGGGGCLLVLLFVTTRVSALLHDHAARRA